MVLTIVNSYVYIYGKDVQKHRTQISEIAGKYSKIGTGSDKLLLNVDYRVSKEVNSPDDIIDYINEFISYVDDLIEEIEDRVGVIIDYHSVSNIVFSGNLALEDNLGIKPGSGEFHIDLHRIKEDILREYGDRVMKADKPLSNGNEFAGLIITFYIDPTKRNRKGEIIKRRNRTTIILFSNGRFIWTGVNDNLYTDPKKVSFFFDVFKFIVEKAREDEEQLDLTSLYI